ncbi:hypothetical protein Q8A67_023800 [Cirrhinus molitorella]|uniref:Uncharacterized protein n=1 Tax=Cirrhinus molitorella TaxID=172907 RepID=A0AA88P6Q7_9TELE|nr:hypothetical protein Q8A67_023800 [Cirrhinus molitorella]
MRIGTSLQDISASSSLWLVGDVWALKLPTSSPKTGVARQSSIPPLELQPRANYARLHADETCSCQALHACYKSPFRGLCLSDWTGYGGAGESSPISLPQIQPAPLLSSVCQQV